jgi:hypothetical protein
MDPSERSFALSDRQGSIWGSRGREFKSRQPDSKTPNRSAFRTWRRSLDRRNVATGGLTTGKPLAQRLSLGAVKLSTSEVLALIDSVALLAAKTPAAI